MIRTIVVLAMNLVPCQEWLDVTFLKGQLRHLNFFIKPVDIAKICMQIYSY